MVICPVCNKENNDEKYCTDCGAKLVDVKDNPIFEFDEENNDISKVDELNIYLNELNKKINQQTKVLDELNKDPLIKEYGTISKINDENNELKKKIEQLETDNEKIFQDLKQQKKRNFQLQSENERLKSGGTVAGRILNILGSNKSNNDANFCRHCGKKL